MSLKVFFIRLVAYVLVLAGIFGVIAYDASTENFGETSATEYAQEFLLILILLISFFSTRRYGTHRAFNLSLGTMAAIFLVREFNNYAYEHLFPYAWQVGVLAILICYAVFLYRNFGALQKEFTSVANSYSFAILLMGLLIVHIFSRLYGLPFLWEDIMGDGYMRVVVRASEESIELLGYSILFIGVCEFYLLTKQKAEVITRESHSENSRRSREVGG